MAAIHWQQIVTLVVLLFVLYAVMTDKVRFDIAAFGGLLALGLLKITPTSELFLGFSDTSVFVVAAVMIISSGIVESGLLNGLGRSIAEKVQCPKRQIYYISLVTGGVSAFMNNVGAIGLLLPTAKRMAKRAGVHRATFGIPMVYATVLGGSITLIGCSPNIIISTFRFQALGQPFRMFDYAPHGLTMLLSAVIIWFVAQKWGYSPLDRRCVKGCTVVQGQKSEYYLTPEDVPTPERNPKKSRFVLFTFIPAVVLAAFGLVPTAVGFGLVAVLFILLGVISWEKAYGSLKIPALVFLGSMVSISTILEDTGTLALLIDPIEGFVADLPHLLAIIVFVLISAILANTLDNSVAAILMSPVALLLTQSNLLSISADALLMAVSAGASLGIIVPIDQAAILALTEMDFSTKRFAQQGIIVAGVAGLAASLMIKLVWA